MNNSSVTINGTSTNTSSVYAYGFNLKPVKLIGTYKLSGYTRNDSYLQLYWKDKNGNIKYKEMKNNPTITFDEGDYLFQLFIFASSGTIMTFNNETFNLQLEEGTTATTYEPYHTPITYPISLGSNKLYGLTNTYKDMFVTDRVTKKWYISRDIDEVVLDRTMRWNSPATYQYNVSNISPYMLASNDGSTSKCNYFVSVQSFTTDSDFRNYISSNNLDNVYDIHINGSGIRFWTTKFSTLEAFLTWLDSVNLKVLVVRPDILTEVTDTTLIEQLENWYNSKSFFGTTIIESNGDLPMIIKVRALKGN